LSFPQVRQEDFFPIFPKLPGVVQLKPASSFVFLPYITRESHEIAIFSVLRPAKTMHKQDLIDEVARRTPLTRHQVRQALHSVLEVVAEAIIAGEPVTLVGFGRFEARERQGRDVHGRDGRIYRVERRLVPSFSPYPSLRRRVRNRQAREE
jgi:DNA-binding protein HU-beta